MPRPERKLHEGDRRKAVVGVKGTCGNPGHEWSPVIAHKVETLAALGLNQTAIAFANDINAETLTKYYRKELEQGATNANLKVGTATLNSALGERVECPECDGEGTKDEDICPKCKGSGEGREWRREPSTTAQIWWSKNRMGWTDREQIEHVGPGGGPLIHEMVSSADTIKQRLNAIQKRIEGDPAMLTHDPDEDE
jgi:hypothetical protein